MEELMGLFVGFPMSADISFSLFTAPPFSKTSFSPEKLQSCLYRLKPRFLRHFETLNVQV
jgi:hypothetical protein